MTRKVFKICCIDKSNSSSNGIISNKMRVWMQEGCCQHFGVNEWRHFVWEMNRNFVDVYVQGETNMMEVR